MIKTVEFIPGILAIDLAEQLTSNLDWLIFDVNGDIDWQQTKERLREFINDFLN